MAALDGCSADENGPAISGITLDSRQVRPGDLYVGLRGLHAHGARFAASAVEAGAVAVLTDAEGATLAADAGVPIIVVPHPRAAMAVAAATIFGHPADDMTMFGITGTNGKTTTAFLVEAGLRSAGHHVGTIGTIGFRLDGAELPSARTTVTTPEAPDLQGLFAAMAQQGATDVVMEVSSHALALQRVNGTRFDVAAFTNLGRDHLDFHKTLDEYFEAKARLFTPDVARIGVINVDDPRGRQLVERMQASGVTVVTTSIHEPADYQVTSWYPGPRGAIFDVTTPSGQRTLELSLPGEYNVRNAAMALAMLEAAGLSFDEVVQGLCSAQVPGRMERVDLGPDSPTVLVDFAHTPQAIASALDAARSSVHGGRLIAVLGAGGDRDAAKRGPMGRVAAERADVVIITDDNPRTEDPAVIRAAVLEGAHEAARDGVIVVDGGRRREAINEALRMAEVADVICVLGKGHETGQHVGSEVLPFDDREVIRAEWHTLAGRAEEDLTR
ncbi:UDP-N-acetylmuramoyl-L-alanyl-D-glutamate--2,6-diaminopimelate ligase [Cutibacterium equinum]|uniref:UDP-N-acetylmuramoyl-L-alanyl-D-glutamate--2,6-diaminopimelate ligase n=1 Tax=Cutibacterium equinum TaxID=3016342 RepID=A0ABY7R2R4_9ACTN|nr:UDP-N-acetylmuramoyl-L-alanyl-D-glutamate--2,6-diaminopimelate ligase [Cutibacterium equinum]WCC81033.1 UDP-N-acetylmuramoyl-L-alanyl-D-glutamate--2,6-diaminopimelate ligase [Cutibacterium equinum]